MLKTMLRVCYTFRGVRWGFLPLCTLCGLIYTQRGYLFACLILWFFLRPQQRTGEGSDTHVFCLYLLSNNSETRVRFGVFGGRSRFYIAPYGRTSQKREGI